MIWNVIDRRTNRFRWKTIHAIIESTWHDNAVSGADKAPESAAETDVDFEERKNVTVNEAIGWANGKSGPVTLYLSDGGAGHSLSSIEVDAAARILDGWGRCNNWWSPTTPSFDDLDSIKKSDFRFIVEGMLRAAAAIRSEQSA